MSGDKSYGSWWDQCFLVNLTMLITILDVKQAESEDKCLFFSTLLTWFHIIKNFHGNGKSGDNTGKIKYKFVWMIRI